LNYLVNAVLRSSDGHANGLSEDFARLSAEKAELEAKVAELASTVSKNKKLKRELKYVKGQLKQAEVTLTASVADRDEALMQLAAQDHINSSMDASFISETLQEEIKEREVLLKENEDLREQLLQAQAQAAAAPAQANEFFGASEDVCTFNLA
jgi:chromosome segregation ATPase